MQVEAKTGATESLGGGAFFMRHSGRVQAGLALLGYCASAERLISVPSEPRRRPSRKLQRFSRRLLRLAVSKHPSRH